MQRPEFPPDKLSLAQRESNRASPPVRVENSWLPAIQKSPRALRFFDRSDKLAHPRNDGAGNSFDPTGNAPSPDSGPGHWPKSSGTHRAVTKTPDEEAGANLVRPAESQREIGISLRAAQNVIESLETSVRLLQEALARQEEEMAALKESLLLPHKKNLLKAYSEKAGNDFTAPSDQVDCRQPGRNAREQAIDDRFAEFRMQVKILASTLLVQNEQIEKLKTACMALATRSDNLAGGVRAVEVAQKCSHENIRQQTEMIRSLKSALQAESVAAEQTTVKLIWEIRRERSARSAAERNLATIRNEIGLLLPALAAAWPALKFTK